MRRAVPVATMVAAIVAALAGCNDSRIPDQGTVRTCFNTIGVAEPDQNTLGSVQGWVNVADQAIAQAGNEQVRAAGGALKAALSEQVQADGFDAEERQRYIGAVATMQKACKESNAFEGDPRR